MTTLEVLFRSGLLVAGVVTSLGAAMSAIARRRSRSSDLGEALVATGVGATAGLAVTAGIAAVGDPTAVTGRVQVIVALVLGLGAAVVVAMRGRRRLAGIGLAAAAVPWTLAYVALTIAMLNGVRYAPLQTVGALAAGLVLLLIGVGVAVRGDDLPPVRDARASVGQPGSRRVGAFSRAVSGEARSEQWPIGSVAGVAVVAVAVLLGARAPVMIASAAALGVVVAVEIDRWLAPQALRSAIEAYEWVGRREVARFEADAGIPAPGTPAARQALLLRPETEPLLGARAQLFAAEERFAEALDAASRIPVDTPRGRFDRAITLAYATWSADRPVPAEQLAALAELAAAVGAPEDTERLLAEGEVAFFDAQRRQAAGEPDWLAPLATFRARLGADADGLHLQSRRSFRYATTIPVMAVVAGVAWFLVSR